MWYLPAVMWQGGVGWKFPCVMCLSSVAAMAAIAGCGPRMTKGPAIGGGRAVTERPGGGPTQEGIASWYGPGFHGKKTSSGEVYDQYDLTAAHNTLPLGTRVAVTNLLNQRTVEVRVNDRGPFVGERVLDLSFGAAKALAMIGTGTAPVRIQVLGATGSTLPSVAYAVQVGSFSRIEYARELRRKLAAHLDGVYVLEARGDDETIFRVRIGPYQQREQADRQASEVRRMGWSAIIMEETVAAR